MNMDIEHHRKLQYWKQLNWTQGNCMYIMPIIIHLQLQLIYNKLLVEAVSRQSAKAERLTSKLMKRCIYNSFHSFNHRHRSVVFCLWILCIITTPPVYTIFIVNETNVLKTWDSWISFQIVFNLLPLNFIFCFCFCFSFALKLLSLMFFSANESPSALASIRNLICLFFFN